MARTTQLSKEKQQSIITLRQEGQSSRKISRTLNVSSAVAKTIKRYDETGSHEDRPRTGRPRVTSAAEDKFIRVTSLRNRQLTAPQIRAHINALQSSSSRHISTSTVQRRLRESGLHGGIAAKKPLLRKNNKKKRLAWAKKHKEWTLNQWKSTLGWWVQIWDFWFHLPCLCKTQKRWVDGFYMCGSHREALRRRCDGVGVLCWWHCFVIYSKFKAY